MEGLILLWRWIWRSLDVKMCTLKRNLSTVWRNLLLQYSRWKDTLKVQAGGSFHIPYDPWKKVLRRMIVVQVIAESKAAYHCALFWVSLVTFHTVTSRFLTFVLIISSYLRLGLSSSLFLSGFPTAGSDTFLPSPNALRAPPNSSSVVSSL
jgi:hypothetical protein